MKKFILIFTGIIESMTLRAWFGCEKFTDIFHYSSINIGYQLEAAINPFRTEPLWFIRFFHNKPVQMLINFLRFYFQFWDIRFGSIWFSVIGYFGIASGIYYIVSNKKKTAYHWIMLIILGILPCIEIFLEPTLSMQLRSLYLWLPFILFSLYGIYQFLSHGNLKKRCIIVGILLLLSFLWIFFLPYDLSRYCFLSPMLSRK